MQNCEFLDTFIILCSSWKEGLDTVGQALSVSSCHCILNVEMLGKEEKTKPFLGVIDDDPKSFDRKLWVDFKNGQEQAFNQLFDKYVQVLYNYGCKIVTDRALIKDCIQELFIDLWKNKESLTAPESITFYLYRSLRRKIFRQLKKENRYAVRGNQLENTAFGIIPSREFEIISQQSHKEKRDFLASALNKLTERQREALYLKYFSELSNKEIARVMSLNRQSVYNLISDGLNALKSALLFLLLCLAMALF